MDTILLVFSLIMLCFGSVIIGIVFGSIFPNFLFEKEIWILNPKINNKKKLNRVKK